METSMKPMRAPATEKELDDAALNKSQKFVRIVELMLQQGGTTSGELMRRFDLDDRTLRRYLADLRAIELPVCSEGRGPSRKLWLDARYGRKGVQVSLLELVSLRFGRQLFDFLEGTGFAQDMDDALETISSLAVGKSAEHARDLERKFMAVPEHRKDHTQDADRIEDILTALLYQNPARAHYAKPTGRTRAYLLHPLTLATYRQGLYLFALDVEEGKVKTFAVDRFRHFERLRKDKFDYPEDYDPKELVGDAFGIIGGKQSEVTLRFRRRASPYVRERVWHRSQQVEATSDGGVRLRIEVGLSPELESWILGFGPDVRVEGPPELAERIRRLHIEAAEGTEMPSVRARR